MLELADGSAGRCPLVKSDNAKAVSNRRGWACAGVASACRTGADAALEVAAGGASSDPAADGEVRLPPTVAACVNHRPDRREPVPRPVGGDGQRYMPGLDGLRAIAVLAVIAFHLNAPWAPGGLLGVGMFFTLSGYLITDLLLSS